MANRVTVVLEARDEASKVLGNFTGSIRDGVLQANLLGSAFGAALDVAKNAMGAITGKIGEAMTIESSTISTSGTLMKMIGMNYAEAGTFIDGFSQRMSIAAAALPGNTQGYTDLGTSIMDNLVPAFRNLDGSFDKKGFSDNLDAITKAGGFLAATSEASTQDASLGISKFLGGESESALSHLKFFEANPAVLGFIKTEASKLGKDLEDLTTKEKAEVLQRAMAVPPDVVSAAMKSVDGLTQGFLSSLFDPRSGIFGLLKDLNGKVDGNQSAYSAIGESFVVLFGSGGTMEQIGKIFGKMTGMNVDSPMQGLRDGVLWLNGKLKYVTLVLRSIQQGWGVDSVLNDMKFMFKSMFKGIDAGVIGGQIASYFNGAMPIFIAVLPKYLNALVAGASFLIDGAASFLTHLDYGAMFVGLGNVLAGLDWGAIGGLAFKIFAGVVLVSAGIAAAGLIGVPGVLVASIGAVVVGTAAVIAAKWSEISAFIGGAFSALGGFITEHWQIVLTAVSPPLALLATGFVGLHNNITENWSTITKTANSAFSGLVGMFNSIQSWVMNAIRSIPGIGGLIPSGSNNAPPTQTIASAPIASPNLPTASGQTFNFANGNLSLLSAVQRERARMPAGSSIVVANSSEAILNRSQQQGLGGNSLVINGGITITASGGDVESIAKGVMAAIEREWVAFQRSKVSPGFG